MNRGMNCPAFVHSLRHRIGSEISLLRHSLIAVWLITIAVSVLEWNGQSLALLQQGGIRSLPLAHGLTAAGVALDVVVALALALRPGRAAYALAAGCVVGLTLVATALLPALWLHPIGPLSKNLPVLAILFVLWRRSP